MRKYAQTFAIIGLIAWCAAVASAAPAPVAAGGQESLARMPIKEVTVFKDGHAFVLHEGKVATDAAGRVVLDYLPSPVLGTFWSYSADPKVKLTGVVAGKHRVAIQHTSLTISELIEGNVGVKVRITEVSDKEAKDPAAVYEATILGVPQRSGDELARTSPPGTEERLPQKGGVVLLKMVDGVRAVPIERIESVTFLDEPRTASSAEEFRNLLTLRLDWGDRKPAPQADVGMVYLQKGLRWIPEYRVEIDGKGKAHLRLQATLINELADLQDVRVNLVVGVPAFAFKDTLDPMALQATATRLSSYFQQGSPSANAFSNAIMSQTTRMSEARGGAEEAANQAAPADLGPEVAATQKSEDLFIYTVEHLTLRKGERMVVPVAEFDLDYKDVYRLDLTFSPPPEVRQQFDSNRQLELARLLSAPKVMHNVRLVNKSKFPLTTAPAMILSDGRPLAQGMMKYTAIGATGDLEVTAAVDIAVDRKDKETGRAPNAAKWHGHSYDRIDLAGSIHLTNRKTQAVEIEVQRHILGIVDTAGQDGRIEQALWTDGGLAGGEAMPLWWSWYSWGPWWYEFNGIGRITWKVKLEPGKSVDLDYTWHYFWG